MSKWLPSRHHADKLAKRADEITYHAAMAKDLRQAFTTTFHEDLKT